MQTCVPLEKRQKNQHNSTANFDGTPLSLDETPKPPDLTPPLNSINNPVAHFSESQSHRQTQGVFHQAFEPIEGDHQRRTTQVVANPTALGTPKPLAPQQPPEVKK